MNRGTVLHFPPQPHDVDCRLAFDAFLAMYASDLAEDALAIADGEHDQAADLEQTGLIEVWILDPSRYDPADWPFLVEAARREMKRLRRQWRRAQRRRRMSFSESQRLYKQASYMRRAEREEEQ